ncbi:uncharacterized protein MONBRDRAFT_30228 [Monosiga brevicollis MX1]|uniref:Uncharacterized protein n=1 Tax=Monosiga brevicollis TaxID=81824 RepID=A9VDD1_MONBE|nr:uncharacterized protein MONBRDRAFT_30228 [Monosiga brevicollis MX1]EDQ84452.1 predicted protein [Monosiga brevicollis MX1]|eukprot:XP_001750747.1 hypothetical protein [Monosiga brevicollis MX1]
MSDDGAQLFRACVSNRQKAVQLLTSWDHERIQAAAQYKNLDGHTALHWACFNDHVEVVEMLLKHGADAKAKTNFGWTPLHWACREGRVEVVEMLLEHGVDTDAKTDDGQTPLHTVCTPISVNRKVIRQLLRHGADPDARDLTGARPLDLLIRGDPIERELIEELLGASRTPCSQTLNSQVQGLIHAEQMRRRIGSRVDPQLFNLQDLQMFCDCLAAQVTPTN